MAIPMIPGATVTLLTPSDEKSAPELWQRPVRPWQATEESFWDFATERQDMLIRRLHDWERVPLTTDPTLQVLKVDQVYKILDRDSQFYLKEVLNKGSQDPWELLWRSLLFKTYPQTYVWEQLVRYGHHEIWGANVGSIRDILRNIRSSGKPIYASAFMATGFSFERDDREIEAFQQIWSLGRSGRSVFPQTQMDGHALIRSLPGYGDFYAWQVVGDLRWSAGLRYWAEAPVAPMGPGSLKCAALFGYTTPSEAHKLVRRLNLDWLKELNARGFVPNRMHDQTRVDAFMGSSRMRPAEIEGLMCEFQKVLNQQANLAAGKRVTNKVWKPRPRIEYELLDGRRLDSAQMIVDLVVRNRLHLGE